MDNTNLENIIDLKEKLCHGNPKWYRSYDICRYFDKNINCSYLQRDKFCYNIEQTQVLINWRMK